LGAVSGGWGARLFRAGWLAGCWGWGSAGLVGGLARLAGGVGDWLGGAAGFWLSWAVIWVGCCAVCLAGGGGLAVWGGGLGSLALAGSGLLGSVGGCWAGWDFSVLLGPFWGCLGWGCWAAAVLCWGWLGALALLWLLLAGSLLSDLGGGWGAGAGAALLAGVLLGVLASGWLGCWGGGLGWRSGCCFLLLCWSGACCLGVCCCCVCGLDGLGSRWLLLPVLLAGGGSSGSVLFGCWLGGAWSAWGGVSVLGCLCPAGLGWAVDLSSYLLVGTGWLLLCWGLSSGWAAGLLAWLAGKAGLLLLVCLLGLDRVPVGSGGWLLAGWAGLVVSGVGWSCLAWGCLLL